MAFKPLSPPQLAIATYFPRFNYRPQSTLYECMPNSIHVLRFCTRCDILFKAHQNILHLPRPHRCVGVKMSDRVQESVQNAILRRIDDELVESKLNFIPHSISPLKLEKFVVYFASGTDDVMSSLHVDHHQLSETWNRALAFAVQTTPIQQFGIGFGVGW